MKRIGKNILATAGVAVVASIGILGCGSSGSESSAEAPLTRAQFLRQGDQICQKGLRKKDEAVKAALGKSFPTKDKALLQKARTELVEEVLTVYGNIADRLGDLTPPQKDEAAVAGILAKMHRDIEKGEARPEDAGNLVLLVAARRAAEAYGLTGCAF
jgi:hypothetical protein